MTIFGAELVACPKCGATDGLPCIPVTPSPTGRVTTIRPHKERARDVVERGTAAACQRFETIAAETVKQAGVPRSVEWCAGLFVGEGSSFTRARKNPVPQVMLSINMKDRSAIYGFAACFDFSVEHLPYFRDTSQTIYRTRASGIRAIEALISMLPYMHGTDKATQTQATLAAGLVRLTDSGYVLDGRRGSPETRLRMAVAQQARRARERGE